MEKHKQDKDEQLQIVWNAPPKNFFWADQGRPSRTIDQAWKILVTELGDERKLMMDGLRFNITFLLCRNNSWICENMEQNDHG